MVLSILLLRINPVSNFPVIENQSQHLIGKVYNVGLKQDTDEIGQMTFENEEVTSSLFNDEEVEHSVHKRIKFIKIHCFFNQIRNGNCRSATGASTVLYEQF
jgi:hypothetical protein